MTIRVKGNIFSDKVPVRISSKMARLLFISCGPDCIKKKGCTGKCCDAPTLPGGMKVTILPFEEERIKRLGVRVINGELQPVPEELGCPFKDKGLCILHDTPDKPFGCIASPFKLTNRGTLVIRNRYKRLPCYDNEGRPAYEIFRPSLDLIFGEEEASKIVRHLDGGGGDIIAEMDKTIYVRLMGRELLLKGEASCRSRTIPNMKLKAQRPKLKRRRPKLNK
ncbi:hypothetical protein LCGC14_0231640 [marine sediment metagenome]|uniref:Uncharacterized protein n=1 Tax=marine sediment metagenome TaxID=412755 RepID=A0A0F9WUM0_9ZZZZ